MGAAGIIALLVLAGQSPAPEQVLVAGQDVPPPRQLRSPAPAYPELARQAQIQGLVILGVTVDESARPVDIRILRGIPILNEAAVEALKTWRYEPATVDGISRRVKFVEHVGFFASDRDKLRAYSSLTQDRRSPTPLRLFAISQLVHIPRKLQKDAAEALEAASKDPDSSVAAAAKAALERLVSAKK